MPEVYQKHIRVTEPECDYHQRMFLSQLMRHSQQMGSDHLLQIGIDYNQMYQDGMVFLVNKLLITVERRPTFGENLLLTTVPKQPKGAQFIRDTYFETEEGEKLATVSISWMLADPIQHKILRPSAFDRYGITMFPNTDEQITRYRIKRPEGLVTTHLRQIRFTDLDYNHHVNNAVYADIVCDILPVEEMLTREPKRFGIVFQHEAKLGQILEMDVIRSGDGNGYFLGAMADGERCFEAELFFEEPVKEVEKNT